MLKYITLCFFSVFYILTSKAQQTEWIIKAGGPNTEKGISVGTDSLGYIYISGYFNGSITFGSTTLTSSYASNKDIFVCKMDSFGNYIWAISGGGGPFDDRALGMHVTPAGYVFLTGTFWGNITFTGQTANGNGHDSSLLTKIDPNGNCVWVRSFGAAPNGNCPWPIYDGDDHSYDVKVDKDGFIYVTGFFSGTSAIFDNFTLTNSNWSNCQPLGYVGKLDPSGNFVWVHKFDGVYDQRGSRDNRIAIDNFSNVFVTGGFENNGVYGPFSLVSNGEWDAFIFKMDKNGNWIWAKNVGSNKADRGNGIAIDDCDNIYIAGEYRNPMYFAGSNASGNSDTLKHSKKRDIFVAKMTTHGDWIWAKRARSSGTDKPYQMSVDKNKQVFICGSASDTLKFNDNLSIGIGDTTANAFIAQLDGSGTGEWVWAKMGGGDTDDDRTNDICEDGKGNTYAIGFYEHTTSFDGNTLTNAGKKDIFVWRVKKDQTVNITPTNCLYFDVQPPGSGTISLNGKVIPNYPCLMSVSDSANQMIDATAAFGYYLVNWQWNIHNPLPNASSANTIVYTYSNDTVIATFQTAPVYNVTYLTNPVGAGNIDVNATNFNLFPITQNYTIATNIGLMANDNPNYLFSHWSSQSHNLLPNVQNDMVNYTVQNNDTIIAHYDEIDTLWVITKPDNVATLHIGNDIVNTSPYMGLYQKSTIIPIKAFPNGNNVFNEWRLNNNNLPDYNTQTFFNFINDDTLFAYFNNVLSIEQLDNDFTLAQVYPSIVENDFTIQLESKETLAITIDLYDVLGKKIETLYQGLVSNNALFKQDYSLLQPKGVYIVQLKYKNAVANFKLIKN